MQYALLIYDAEESPAERAAQTVPAGVAEMLGRPSVAGWARLHAAGSATTLHHGEGAPLLTDGPFVESKEYIAGLIFIDADDLDGALAIAEEFQATRSSGAIEVRPVIEGRFHGA
ncbi:MAG TPA: YciI family protein [Dactylosporangium sp.]|jgi:hypothetical protein|nr:YciI family protein [Dactylosporangium sp.]